MKVESLLWFIINPNFLRLFALVGSVWNPGVHYLKGLGQKAYLPLGCSYQPANIVGLAVYFPGHCFCCNCWIRLWNWDGNLVWLPDAVQGLVLVSENTLGI